MNIKILNYLKKKAFLTIKNTNTQKTICIYENRNLNDRQNRQVENPPRHLRTQPK